MTGDIPVSSCRSSTLPFRRRPAWCWPFPPRSSHGRGCQRWPLSRLRTRVRRTSVLSAKNQRGGYSVHGGRPCFRRGCRWPSTRLRSHPRACPACPGIPERHHRAALGVVDAVMTLPMSCIYPAIHASSCMRRGIAQVGHDLSANAQRASRVRSCVLGIAPARPALRLPFFNLRICSFCLISVGVIIALFLPFSARQAARHSTARQLQCPTKASLAVAVAVDVIKGTGPLFQLERARRRRDGGRYGNAVVHIVPEAKICI